MCYHTLLESKKEKLELAFKAEFYEGTQYEPKLLVNGFDNPRTPIIMNDNPRLIANVYWGLIPHWASIEKAKTIRKKTLIARAESISELASYKDSVNRRCLVIVDGFYEKKTENKKENSINYILRLKDEDCFAIGGIWSFWKNPQKQSSYIRSFAIITVPANPLIAEIQKNNQKTEKRMPLIIPKKHYQDWLNPEAKDLGYIIKTFDERLMEAKVLF